MISLRNFALRRGERLLLSNVDLTLHAGYRVGVVGRNGAGKSSLFAAVKGELEADKGDVDLPGKIRIASVAQETPSLPDPALQFVLEGDTEVAAVMREEAAAAAREDWEAVATAHQRMAEIGAYDAEARAGKLLHGLGFPAETHSRAVSSFSGGWRVRLNLARALMMPSDLLLLDEPTNHLDLDAVFWLEQWLLKYPGTLLLISHDREFLDNVATHTLHLHGGGAKLYVGGYTDFERQRAEQLRQQQLAHEKEQAERAHLQSFIDRFKAQASKAAQAQSRMKRLAKLAGTEAVRAEREFRIEFAPPAKLPFSLIRLNHVEAGYGADSVILHNVGFGLEAGQRIGLLGPNGAGKTTVMRVLATLTRPDAGTARVLGRDVVSDSKEVRRRVSLTGQFASLDEDLTGRDNLRLIGRLFGYSGRGARSRAEELLDAFSLTDAGDKQVKKYSGGMRRRLDIAASIVVTPELLFLDEPTTGLDPRSRNEVWDIVRAMVSGGTTVLLTTQYLEEADQLADRITVIDRGQVIAEGASAELKASVGSGTLVVRVMDRADRPAAREVLGRELGVEVREEIDPSALTANVAGSAGVTRALTALEDAGITLAQFSLGQPTLDEVFLSITGHTAEDDDTEEQAA